MTTPQIQDPSELDLLGFDWEQNKKHVDSLNKQRLAIEKRMLKHVTPVEEGTVNVETDYYNFKVTFKLDRKPDQNSLKNIALSAVVLNSVYPQKRSLNLTNYRNLKSTDPDAYKIATQPLITKPAKPSFKITHVERAAEE